jgi:hypothetical protein
MTSGTRIQRTLASVVAAMQQMGVQHFICGSVASSIHGEPRTTVDIDLVANLSPAEAGRLAELVGSEFYADADSMIQAVQERRSFNLVHLETGLKVDVFPLKDRDYDYGAMERRHSRLLPASENAMEVSVCSAEDTILSKLEWYRLGHEISDRQWRDLVSVLRLRNVELDHHYLDRWATRLDVKDLLDRARCEIA